MHQLNDHCKKIAELLFVNQNITVTSKASPLQYPNNFVQDEVDFVVKRAESVNNLDMTCYRKMITIGSLNIIQHPVDKKSDTIIYSWRGMAQNSNPLQTEETMAITEESQSKCNLS